jgi:nitrogen fixation/metabolism regulation signal transduction histidine kinase
MKKPWSIQQMLTSSTMLLINSLFILLFSLTIISNAVSVNKNIKNSKNTIDIALIVKGDTLAIDDSNPMRDQLLNKENTAIQALISSTISTTAKTYRNQIISIILILWIVSLLIGYLMIKRTVNLIARPIDSLLKSTKLITQGNYSVSIKPECYDEISSLAANLESMRGTIKKYTGCLQDIVDEKILQLNDILSNIDQGLFTINLDGSVNQEYSVRANQIFKVSDIASSSLQTILRMDEQQLEAFHIWLELIQKRYHQIHWSKLARLAPVQGLEFLKDPDKQDIDYVSISYQCIFDTENKLSKIMILATNLSEKRFKELYMTAQKQTLPHA